MLSLAARIAGTAVAVTLVSAPSALAASKSVFGGSTSAGEPIAVVADRSAKTLKSATIAVVAPCDDGHRYPLALTVKPGGGDLDFKRNAKGRFAADGGRIDSLGDQAGVWVVSFAGRLKAHRASGTLEFVARLVDKATQQVATTCESGKVSWSATRAPGQVYAGATAQQEPVVVKLDRRRKKVSDMYAGWESASCTPDRFVRIGDSFSDFPLTAGHFGDSWTSTQDGPSGSKVNVAYDLAGTVGRSSASGSLHVAMTQTDGSGATLLTCDTGQVSWKAITG